ncbi:MAG: T9SS type A sorting domain-containing protein [Bacteroidetes bacterium]|nr:T9SS type A sorting domain-containing protein [Bacteroidota bacterium]
MKKHLLSLTMLVVGLNVQAQSEIFALTGQQSPQIIFKDFRALNMNDGQTSDIIFSSDSTPNVFSETRKIKIDEPKNSYNSSQAQAMATLALDSSGNQLVYMPMYSTNFYALDLKTKNISLIESTVSKAVPCDINTHFTRMTTGYDGNIYTLNNAGTQLLKISKENGQFIITDLGALSNDSSNGENKLQIMSVGFGGDLVADTQNNLYIFSAAGNVFQFNPNEKIAKFLGKITGLPENYSLNGAAVNEKGGIVIGSAKGGNMYEVNLENLSAKPIYGEVQHQIYDLASKYFIGEKRNDIAVTNNDIFPTKVTDGIINIQLENTYARTTIRAEIFNMAGIKVIDKIMANERKISVLGLPQGMYIVNIAGDKGESLITKKILIAK